MKLAKLIVNSHHFSINQSLNKGGIRLAKSYYYQPANIAEKKSSVTTLLHSFFYYFFLVLRSQQLVPNPSAFSECAEIDHKNSALGPKLTRRGKAQKRAKSSDCVELSNFSNATVKIWTLTA